MIGSAFLTPLVEKLHTDALTREISATLFITPERRIVDTLVTEGEADMLILPLHRILARGIETGAHQIMLLHSHPSGDPRPSCQDVAATRRLCLHLRRRGLRLMDHIIVTRDHYFSFRANAML
ncbi:MAG: hypothetical protein EP321_04340 [Sphingomonadales bacterium]|nr:MAG: hypothetical protein EP345_05805 [Sphingomonadales bacterium]TNF05269.1 MAG: hypothetical protein EP321_04340 [Sphingomonadales bacterium]